MKVRLNYPKKPNGMYVLKKSDFEDIAEDILREYIPRMLEVPRALDVDHLIRDCLGLDILPRVISPDGSLLGMMVFQDVLWPTFRAYHEEPQRIEHLCAGTMLIDKFACGSMPGRSRFTKMHEGSHWVLHRSRRTDPDRTFEFRKEESGYVACRSETVGHMSTYGCGRWDTLMWEEWQANSLAAALLMPREPFTEAFQDAMRKRNPRRRYLVEGECTYDANEIIDELAECFDVSRTAVRIRLRQFGLLRSREML